jgi:hypothetical protein
VEDDVLLKKRVATVCGGEITPSQLCFSNFFFVLFWFNLSSDKIFFWFIRKRYSKPNDPNVADETPEMEKTEEW